MRNYKLFFLTMLFGFALSQEVAFAQSSLEWERTIGGPYNELSNAVEQTNDGGYVVAGWIGTGYYIQKLGAAGNLEWASLYGGSGFESAESIEQTTDGGYIVCGISGSNDGSVGGNNGGWDYWILKLGVNGNLIWEKNFGGSGFDSAYSVKQTTDGGYIVVGHSDSSDGDISSNNGLDDIWLIKLDGSGNLEWEKSYGGSATEIAQSVQQTSDGGYVVSGWTESIDGDVTKNNGGADYWIIKLDSTGNLQWEKSYGGSDNERSTAVQQTLDGGYIATGLSYSNDGDVGGNNGSDDFWVVKLDAAGDLEWEENYGGTNSEVAKSIQQTADGRYIVAGESGSSNGDIGTSYGDDDFWIIKIDTAGNLEWEKNFGGSDDEAAHSIQQTTDGGYIVAGWTKSSDGNISINNGERDWWIIKLSSDPSSCDLDLVLDGAVENGTYRSGNTISSSGTTNGNVIFEAAESILLEADFCSEPGGIFEAKIQPCHLTKENNKPLKK